MTTVGYPTGDFPAPLPFSLDLPDGWLGAHMPGTLLAAHAPGESDDTGLTANVVVTWQLAAADSDVRGLANLALVDAQSREDYREPSALDGTSGDDGVDVALAAFGTAGDPVDTMHAALFVAGPVIAGRRDLYHVVGTYPGGDDELHGQIRRMMLSFAVAIPGGRDAEAVST